jgi:hypothetical protein
MSTSSSVQIARIAAEAGLELTWAQWSALGSLATSRRRPAIALVDPEALILFSLHLAPLEARLLDQVGWWAEVGSELTSVKRMKSIVARIPIWESGLKSFATLALEAGDKRWRAHAAGEGVDYRRGKGPPQLSLAARSTVWLRLRAGFGVGAKADVLAFLLGIRGSRVVVREIADACGYSAPTIKAAADDLARSRFIRRLEHRPAEYYAPPGPWAEILEVDVLPEWRFWVATFAFLTAAADWAGSVERGDLDGRLAASGARDLIDRHMAVMHLESLPARDPRGLKGDAVVGVLHEMVRSTAEWARCNV